MLTGTSNEFIGSRPYANLDKVELFSHDEIFLFVFCAHKPEINQVTTGYSNKKRRKFI